MTSLWRDQAGNTMVMTAAAILPLLAMIGGAVDASRIYLVQSRLQSACDAGALASRRAMAGVNWTTASREVALDYFGMNFSEGRYGTGSLEMDYSADSSGAVMGEATVLVPMTIMEIFSAEPTEISVSCTADLNLPNTDVMMVLDTTLSMNDPNPGDSIRRIDALTNAVTSFYNTLEAAKPEGSRIRYGFVPYSHTVNVGSLLKRDWIQNEGTYDSREPDGIHTWQPPGSPPPETVTQTTTVYLSGTNATRPRYQAPSENCPASLPRENWSDTSTNWSAWSPSATALPRSRTRSCKPTCPISPRMAGSSFPAFSAMRMMGSGSHGKGVSETMDWVRALVMRAMAPAGLHLQGWVRQTIACKRRAGRP
jgi:Flp pilus assembly protein TadG